MQVQSYLYTPHSNIHSSRCKLTQVLHEHPESPACIIDCTMAPSKATNHWLHC